MTRFTADVVHLAADPRESDRFCTVAIEGDAFTVARHVANLAARRRYGDEAESSFLMQCAPCAFQAAIGVYRCEAGQGVVRGGTVAIRPTEVRRG
jgi:hypothetical protein